MRFLATCVLASALLSPAALIAQDHDHQTHEWTANEDPHWHEYLKERKTKDHDWDHATKKEQEDYWKWRDKHPDKHPDAH
jgi:hypothetical protein